MNHVSVANSEFKCFTFSHPGSEGHLIFCFNAFKCLEWIIAMFRLVFLAAKILYNDIHLLRTFDNLVRHTG